MAEMSVWMFVYSLDYTTVLVSNIYIGLMGLTKSKAENNGYGSRLPTLS